MTKSEKRETFASIAGRTLRDIQVFVLSQGLIPYGITIGWTKRSLRNIVLKICWVVHVSTWLVTSYNVCAGPNSIFSCVFTNAELGRGLPDYLREMPSFSLVLMFGKVVVANFIVPTNKSTRPFEKVFLVVISAPKSKPPILIRALYNMLSFWLKRFYVPCFHRILDSSTFSCSWTPIGQVFTLSWSGILIRML